MSHFVSRQSAYQAVGGKLREIMGTFSTALLKSTKLRQQPVYLVATLSPQHKRLQLMYWAGALAAQG